MAQLPQSPDQVLVKWKSQLDPVLSNPLNQSGVISDIPLSTDLIMAGGGIVVVNHKLGRKMQGWFITDINFLGILYRVAPFNDLTLSLSVYLPAAPALNVSVFSIGVF